jgi:mRNA-degrading endonuclease RelE of RelBE toxin-antitoxin system
MEVVIMNSYLRSIKKTRNVDLLSELKATVDIIVEAKNLTEISDVKKMSGADGFYRTKIVQFGLGIFVDNSAVQLIVFANCKDIYKKFP